MMECRNYANALYYKKRNLIQHEKIPYQTRIVM